MLSAVHKRPFKHGPPAVQLRDELINTRFETYKLSSEKLFSVHGAVQIKPRLTSTLAYPTDFAATAYR